MASTRPKPVPPEIAGWEILGHLGAGGMGDVWKARRGDGALAAVKVVKPLERLSAEAVASLFRREALACLHVDHPNLVRALDAGITAQGSAYLALEFVEGRTLFDVVTREGALPESRVVAIGAGLARALGEVHRMGLVHRDVKPRNVMVLPGGGVKLLDLGLVVEAAGAGRGHGMGTPGFVAPEVVDGEKAEPRADFFSLGATLVAAATGAMPDRERSLADTAPSAAADGRALSDGLRSVLARLLRRDPKARYGSAAEIVLDLEALAAGDRPLGAILGSGGAQAVRRGPRIVLGAAVVGVVAAGVWWLAKQGGETVPVAPAPAPAETAPPPVARDPALEATRVFLERFPDDFVRGRELLAQADAPALTESERGELDAMLRDWERRFAAAAEREHAERAPRVQAAIDAGDVPGARAIASQWPQALRDSPRGAELAGVAEAAATGVRVENRVLAATARTLAAGSAADGEAKAAELIRRIDAAAARAQFEGDARDELAAARTDLEAFRERSARARSAAEVVSRWRSALAAHVAGPSAARLREALAAASAEGMPPQTRSDAQALASAWERGETWLASRVGALAAKEWCGPRGESLSFGGTGVEATGDDVFLSPLWTLAGGRTATVVAAAKGAEEASAWLLSRGLFDEAAAASGPKGVVTAWLGATPRVPAAPPRAASWPPGFDAALALRPAAGSFAPVPGGDPVRAAWAAAVLSPARPPAPAPRNPAKVAGRDAFLSGDLAKAAASLTDAAVADPRDAEVAALRGRVFLVGARALPTAPAILAALSEGRRAWDLDPRLPAGPLLTAESGIELLDVAGVASADAIRAVTAAACEAADALGRADGRMLLFAGRHALDGGRAPHAAALLRRAAAETPDSAPAALLLARAEHAVGRMEKAREALRRARELYGGTLPDAASDLARTLGL